MSNEANEKSEIIDITSQISDLAPRPKIFYEEVTEQDLQKLAMDPDSYLQSRGIESKEKPIEVVFRRSTTVSSQNPKVRAQRRIVVVIVIITDDTIIVIVIRR